jgi:predicted nucleic acid-binding protein
VLLDSTFIHDLVRGDDAAVTKLQELVADETPVTISPLTVYEVGIGLRGDAASLRERFQGVVDDLETAPLGVRQAERALAIQHRLLDRGERIGAVDVLLAGTAATLSDPRVLTRNVDEFERVDAIDVETY